MPRATPPPRRRTAKETQLPRPTPDSPTLTANARLTRVRGRRECKADCGCECNADGGCDEKSDGSRRRNSTLEGLAESCPWRCSAKKSSACRVIRLLLCGHEEHPVDGPTQQTQHFIGGIQRLTASREHERQRMNRDPKAELRPTRRGMGPRPAGQWPLQMCQPDRRPFRDGGRRGRSG